MIIRGETLHRADIDTEVADAALEPVDLPGLVLFDDEDGIGGTPFGAQAAEDAPVDGVINPPPGNIAQS